MTYFNGTLHGFNDARGYHPPEPLTAIYCDPCAETAIPLPETGPRGDRVGRHWGTGFKWAPRFGGESKCKRCGTSV